MSIVSEVKRLKDAKTAIQTAIEGKGVTVPDATMLEGMAALIDSIEAGGGLNATAGTLILSSDTNDYILTHGLGEVPKFFFIGMAENFQTLSGKTDLLIGTFGYSDIDIQYRINASSPSYSPSGILKKNAITSDANNKQSLRSADENTIEVANSFAAKKLIGGATYNWIAIGNGGFD